MCPLRVFVIFLSILIAIIAMAMALAKDPTEEEMEAERLEQEANAKKSLWNRFTDLATGRYLYREMKRLFPFMFSKSAEVVDAEFPAVELPNPMANASAPLAEADDFELVQRAEGQPDESAEPVSELRKRAEGAALVEAVSM